MSTAGLDPTAGPPPTIEIPAPGGGPAGPGPGGPPGPPGNGGGGSQDEAIQHLQDAIDAVTAYKQAEPDAVDQAAAAKILAQLHGLLAKDQQDRDSATSGALNPRLLRKAGAIQ